MVAEVHSNSCGVEAENSRRWEKKLQGQLRKHSICAVRAHVLGSLVRRARSPFFLFDELTVALCHDLMPHFDKG